MPIQSGKLRHRIEVQELSTATAGEFNQAGEAYSTVRTIWARVRPITGRELQAAGATFSERSHVVEIRYYDGLTEKHRFKWGTRCFNIVAIKNVPEEIKEGMEIDCLEDRSKELT